MVLILYSIPWQSSHDIISFSILCNLQSYIHVHVATCIARYVLVIHQTKDYCLSVQSDTLAGITRKAECGGFDSGVVCMLLLATGIMQRQ